MLEGSAAGAIAAELRVPAAVLVDAACRDALALARQFATLARVKRVSVAYEPGASRHLRSWHWNRALSLDPAEGV